jgi:hypothetical protein
LGRTALNGLFPAEIYPAPHSSLSVDDGDHGGGRVDYAEDSHSNDDSEDDEITFGPVRTDFKPIRFPGQGHCYFDETPLPPKPPKDASLADQETWHNHNQFQIQRNDMFYGRDGRGIIKYQPLEHMPVVQNVNSRSNFPRRAKWFWYFLLPNYCSRTGDDFFRIVTYILSQTKWGKLFLVVIIHIIKLQKINQFKNVDGNFLFFF